MRKIVLALALAGTFLSAPANARDGAVYAGVSGGAVFGDGFEAHLELDEENHAGTCLELVHDLAGSLAGARDLSSHHRHLRGYGR